MPFDGCRRSLGRGLLPREDKSALRSAVSSDRTTPLPDAVVPHYLEAAFSRPRHRPPWYHPRVVDAVRNGYRCVPVPRRICSRLAGPESRARPQAAGVADGPPGRRAHRKRGLRRSTDDRRLRRPRLLPTACHERCPADRLVARCQACRVGGPRTIGCSVPPQNDGPPTASARSRKDRLAGKMPASGASAAM